MSMSSKFYNRKFSFSKLERGVFLSIESIGVVPSRNFCFCCIRRKFVRNVCVKFLIIKFFNHVESFGVIT